MQKIKKVLNISFSITLEIPHFEPILQLFGPKTDEIFMKISRVVTFEVR